jgi:hypothetical protein
VRGFWIGLLVGALVGAGGTWAALTQPWKGDELAAVPEVADAAPADTGKGKGKRKRRRRKRNSEQVPIDELVKLTAADRQMISKGPGIKLPPKSVDFEGESGRPLNQSEINAGIQRASRAMISCIAKARGNAEMTAKITLKMLVGPNGRVLKRQLRAPRYLIKNGLYECAGSAAGKMGFPSTGAHTVVTVPFDLD